MQSRLRAALGVEVVGLLMPPLKVYLGKVTLAALELGQVVLELLGQAAEVGEPVLLV